VFTLFVSSTTAWYLNPIVEEKTREVVSIIETPFVILQSDYVYLDDDKIVLTLEIENSATTTEHQRRGAGPRLKRRDHTWRRRGGAGIELHRPEHTPGVLDKSGAAV
jgi:hypothetical protein